MPTKKPKATRPSPKTRAQTKAQTTTPRRAAKTKAAPRRDRPASDAANPKRAADRAWALELVAGLERLYPDAHCELDHADAYQLIVATILSAQSTDKMVNTVTPALFARFPTPAALAAADLGEVERIVHPTGFFRQKAKSVVSCAQSIVADHGGKVPASMEALVKLRGVGRKTANVVLGECFGVPGVVTDTHVIRLSSRLGLSHEEDPVALEQALMALVPREHWTMLSHRLIWHGRRVCFARSPKCAGCGLAALCRWPDKTA